MPRHVTDRITPAAAYPGRMRRRGRRARWWAGAVGCLALALAGCGGGEARRPAALAPLPASTAHPDLSGRWTLSAERAADADEVMRDIVRALRRADPLLAPPEPGALPQSPGGAVPADVGALLVVPRALDIHHADPLLRITVLGRTREVHTDLRGGVVSAGGGARQQVSVAGWEDAAVVVETAIGAGSEVIQRYHLARDGAELHVDYLYDLARLEQPLTLTLVYDRAR